MTGRVVVVGLGPGGPELVDRRTEALAVSVAAEARFARTDRHPSMAVLGEHRSFDAVYESAASLDEVYGAIVEALVDAAGRLGVVVYAVPGSPLVAERTVELLRADPRVEVEVVPCLSFLDLAWARLGVDPIVAGVRLVDGQRFAVEAAGQRGPLLVAQCDSPDVLSGVKLAVEHFPDEPVTVLQRLGLADEAVFEVAWHDLDRRVRPDHLTSLWLPSLAAPVGAELVRFGELVGTLRRRCPWDRQQTHGSLRRYLVEEAYEVLDVLDRLECMLGDGPGGADAGRHVDLGPGDDVVDDLCDELGDLLFQVVFHSEIASEEGWFTLADVARGIHDKLVRRHPHVFGEVDAADAGTVVRNWDQIKGDERARKAGDAPASPFDGVPRALPALAYAAKVQRRAPSPGGDDAGPGASPWADVARRLEGLGAVNGSADPAAELGDLLFALVGLARTLGADPEEALRLATERFRERVDEVAGRRGDVR